LPESKSGALPLGYAPICAGDVLVHAIRAHRRIFVHQRGGVRVGVKRCRELPYRGRASRLRWWCRRRSGKRQVQRRKPSGHLSWTLRCRLRGIGGQLGESRFQREQTRSMQKPIELHCLADRVGDDSRFLVGQLNAGHRSPCEARLQQGAAIGKKDRRHVIDRGGLKIQYRHAIAHCLTFARPLRRRRPFIVLPICCRKRLCERARATMRTGQLGPQPHETCIARSHGIEYRGA
jgi:hypothetical protein